ncbi:hypothetical protein FA13DRAFT_641830 [Coprinellus micaceus]|uniref:Uncharacterized protein n=1 Tax=Coprinellus micaceus TaxID=71717 RepID=A0A4Y7T5L3_COPMI|nr:hypothetical protein FA13DRAFT_641830 [Coprinellus micaceus]
MGTLDEIPVEIMRRVFDFYMEGVSATSPSKLRTPSTLCGVCTTWRDIAVSHPPLWSDVHIHAIKKTKTSPEDDNTFQLSRPLATHLAARLARIGAFPMTLRIEFASITIWGFGQQKLWFEGTLLGGFLKGHPLANLRLLHVDGQGGDVELYPQCLPRLESLIMQHVNRLTVDNEDTVSLSRVPYLRRLVLKETQLSVLPPAFPWSQLSHMYLEAGFDLENLYTTLQATSSLEELFIKFTSQGRPILYSATTTGRRPYCFLGQLGTHYPRRRQPRPSLPRRPSHSVPLAGPHAPPSVLWDSQLEYQYPSSLFLSDTSSSLLQFSSHI